jgi:hypothetical protein
LITDPVRAAPATAAVLSLPPSSILYVSPTLSSGMIAMMVSPGLQ